MKINKMRRIWVMSLILMLTAISITQAQTIDLAAHQPAASPPVGATFEWHNGLPIGSGNLMSASEIAAANPGLYYGVYNFVTCYSVPSYLRVGTNVCPATTADLTTMVDATAVPVGMIISYHTGSPATSANRIEVTDAANVAVDVTYFAAYYDTASMCFTSASPIVIVNTPVPSITGLTVTQPTCNLTTGTIVLNAINASEYSVDNGVTWQSLATFNLLAAGEYNIKARNGVSCEITYISNPVLIINAPIVASVPTLGTITQPTCLLSTGSVDLSSLPSSGTWAIVITPAVTGATGTTGSGTSTTIGNLPSGNYTFAVTPSLGCVSVATESITIEPTPVTASVLTVLERTCITPSGEVSLSGLPSSGTWIVVITPAVAGATGTAGSGTTTTIGALPAGAYKFAVIPSGGCVSEATASTIVIEQPASPLLLVATATNACPATMVDLTTITASNIPSGYNITWHTDAIASTANLVLVPNEVLAGTYYAAFFGVSTSCYTPTTSFVVTTTVCCEAGYLSPLLH